ncbi:MAG: hypothetical protein FWC72_02295, partial [Oscillospiraceae bacterium]|nr:hypothetical protein [Oscillospiraceae bacterium]
MRNFFTVLRFEYRGMVRPKGFIISTAVFLIVLLALANLPLIMGLFNRGGDDYNYEITGEQSPGVFYDATGWYTPEILTAFAPHIAWAPIGSPANIEAGIEAGDFVIGLHLTTQQTTVYAPGGDAAALNWHSFYEMGR